MLFQIRFSKRSDQYPTEKAQPLEHHVGLREITRVELVSPAADHPSSEFQTAIDTHQVRVRVGTEYCVELGFDGEVQGHQIDFRPALPLILSW